MIEPHGLASRASVALDDSHWLRGLATLFNVRPGEGRLVVSLVLLYFCLGLTFLFTQSAAFALFLETFGSSALPYAYMSIAVAVSLVAYAYLKLAGRLELSSLLVVNLAFLLVGSAIFRAGLALPSPRWVIFALPVWFQALINLGLIAFWTLAGRMFDLRQAKRLFGLVGSGYWLAFSAGGFAMPALIAWLGTPNLLLLAAASVGAALGLLLWILRAFPGRLAAPVGAAQASSRRPASSLLQSRYVVLIFAMMVLWWVGFFFIDNIFYDRAYARFADADQLASFLGRLFAAVGILGLLTSLFFTGPIIARYGLWAGRLTMPVLLTLGTAALALTGTLSAATAALFWLAALNKLLNVGLGFSLEQSSLAILYQPLPGDQRVRVQTMAEGIVQPLAIGLAGVLLLLFGTFAGFGAVELSYLFLLIAAAWILVTVALVREYPAMLSRALAKRRLGAATLDLADASTMAVLEQQLRSPYPEAVLYGMRLLEQLDDPSLETVLPALLEHPAPEVRQDALERIARLDITSALPALRRCVAAERSPQVRGVAVRTLATIGEADVLDEVAAYLDDREPDARRGAMVGLLRSGGIEGVLLAGQSLLDVAGSPDAADRALAAQVVGDVGQRHVYQLLLPLLQDREPEVRRAALQAAGNVKHPRLWPAVVDALAIPGLRTAAAQALIAGGEDVVPRLKAAFDGDGQPREARIRLARVCGRIRGQQAVVLLRDQIAVPDAELRTAVLGALSACAYTATGPAAEAVQQQVVAEVAQAAYFLNARADLGDDEQVALLAAALDQQLQQARQRIFFLLSFVSDASAILQARDAFEESSGAHRAYALEVVESRLPQDLKAKVLPLLDELSAVQRLQRLSAAFPQTRLSREQRLQALIQDAETGQEPWIRVCAIYTVGRLRLQSCTAAVVALHHAAEPLVRETAGWTLAQLDVPAREGSVEPNGDHRMLSTIERVAILTTVGIFAATPDDVLAAVAVLLDEVDLYAGETLFEKGDFGDSLYIIVSGSVRVHDGPRTLDELGARAVVGEMALLDPEPRVAGATAVEDSRLLRLLRDPFYELMDDRPEVAHGIIRILTGYVRARLRDVAELHAQLQELERAAPRPPVATSQV